MSMSSALSMWKVYSGGMKKKFHKKALMVAATITGHTDKVMASKETTVSKISATTL